MRQGPVLLEVHQPLPKIFFVLVQRNGSAQGEFYNLFSFHLPHFCHHSHATASGRLASVMALFLLAQGLLKPRPVRRGVQKPWSAKYEPLYWLVSVLLQDKQAPILLHVKHISPRMCPCRNATDNDLPGNVWSLSWQTWLEQMPSTFLTGLVRVSSDSYVNCIYQVRWSFKSLSSSGLVKLSGV